MSVKGSLRRMIVKVHDEEAWYVQSESNADLMYKATLHSCECKAFQYRGGICKHMDKVMTMLANNLTSIIEETEDKDLLIKLLEESIRIIEERKAAREKK
jgi:SWIM zinc finger